MGHRIRSNIPNGSHFQLRGLFNINFQLHLSPDNGTPSRTSALQIYWTIRWAGTRTRWNCRLFQCCLDLNWLGKANAVLCAVTQICCAECANTTNSLLPTVKTKDLYINTNTSIHIHLFFERTEQNIFFVSK